MLVDSYVEVILFGFDIDDDYISYSKYWRVNQKIKFCFSEKYILFMMGLFVLCY